MEPGVRFGMHCYTCMSFFWIQNSGCNQEALQEILWTLIGIFRNVTSTTHRLIFILKWIDIKHSHLRSIRYTIKYPHPPERKKIVFILKDAWQDVIGFEKFIADRVYPYPDFPQPACRWRSSSAWRFSLEATLVDTRHGSSIYISEISGEVIAMLHSNTLISRKIFQCDTTQQDCSWNVDETSTTFNLD